VKLLGRKNDDGDRYNAPITTEAIDQTGLLVHALFSQKREAKAARLDSRPVEPADESSPAWRPIFPSFIYFCSKR